MVTGFYKIGFSHQPHHRIHIIEKGLPFDFVELYTLIPSYEAEKLEDLLHNRFKAKRKKNEWFSLDEYDLLFIDGIALGAKQLLEDIELIEKAA